MQSEIEVKFLNVDLDEVRARLNELGAVCEQPMRLMRRVVFKNDLLNAKNAFVRVRDEGQRTVMTYKQFDTLSIDGAKEIEVVVSSFEETIKLLEQTGLPSEAFQESKRETWKLGGVEVVLDEWPWLKPYVEIEGESEPDLRDVAEKLGFSWSDAVFGDIMAAYRAEYAHLVESDMISTVPEVRFGDPLPDLLKP